MGVKPAEALTRLSRSPRLLFVTLLGLYPIGIVIGEVNRNAFNVPFMDEWDASFNVALQARRGSLTLADLLAQHNEHRVFFSNLITAILTWSTNWDIKLAMYLNIALVAASLIILVDLYRRQNPNGVAGIVIPFSALLFSLRQKVNWLWSFQGQWFLVVFWLLASLWVLTTRRRGWRPVCLAALLAFFAVFTVASGFLLWPVLLITLWMVGYREKRHFGFWIVAAITAIGLYRIGFEIRSIGQDEQGRFVTDVVVLGRYMAAYLGSPFVSGNVKAASLVALGGVILLLTNAITFLARKRPWSELAPWSALGAFAVGSALLTALGRARMFLNDPSQALEMRYVTTSTPLWLSVVALALIMIQDIRNRPEKRWPGVLLMQSNVIAIFLLTVFFVRANYQAANWQWPLRQEQVQCAAIYPIFRQGDCLQGLYPDPKLIEEKIVLLYANRLSLFTREENVGFSLTEVPFSPLGPQQLTEARRYLIDGSNNVVLFQHAPSRVGYSITVPEGLERFDFSASVYVEAKNLKEFPDVPEDGVVFRLSTHDEGDQAQTLATVLFDPNVNKMPMPLTVDLLGYAGKTIQLVLETDARGNPNFDWSMWLNPSIHMVGSDEGR